MLGLTYGGNAGEVLQRCETVLGNIKVFDGLKVGARPADGQGVGRRVRNRDGSSVYLPCQRGCGCFDGLDLRAARHSTMTLVYPALHVTLPPPCS